MSETSMLFDQLARRARVVRGLRYAGIFSACFAGGALLTAILSAILARPVPYLAVVSICGVVVAGTIGFLLGMKLPFSRSIILMRADVSLGFEATLSTLHDIQDKPEMVLFAQRIERRLPTDMPSVQEAFPIRWRESGFVVAAALMLVSAMIVTIIPARSRQIEQQNAVAIEAVLEAADSHVVVEAASESVSQAQDEVDPTADSSASDTTETLTLGDILTNIRSAPAEVTASNNNVDEAMLRPRQTPEQSLDEVLRQIEAKLLEDDTQPLSDLETETLEAHRDSAQGEIAERLESILNASSSEEILRQVSQALADPALADAIQGTELPTSEQGSAQAVKVDPNVDSDSAPLMLDPSADPEGQLVFVETTLPSASGTEGDYTYYLTKGVPIEPPTESTDSSYEDLDLSYEQLDSIASSRSLDPDVLVTIKAYFDRIARGGS